MAYMVISLPWSSFFFTVTAAPFPAYPPPELNMFPKQLRLIRKAQQTLSLVLKEIFSFFLGINRRTHGTTQVRTVEALDSERWRIRNFPIRRSRGSAGWVNFSSDFRFSAQPDWAEASGRSVLVKRVKNRPPD